MFVYYKCISSSSWSIQSQSKCPSPIATSMSTTTANTVANTTIGTSNRNKMQKRWSSTRSLGNSGPGSGSVGSVFFTETYFHDRPTDCGCQECYSGMLQAANSANVKKKNEVIPHNEMINSDSMTPTTWPCTPAECLQMFKGHLTTWEEQEILKYPQVWYLGQDLTPGKKIQGDLSNPLMNYGYDDDSGNTRLVTSDHLSYRYEILEIIGKGSFGQVIRSQDHKTNSQVAIKIIRNKKRFHAQALVEVKILEHLRKRDTDNTIIRMFTSFYFRNHLCIVFELMSLNLYELIRRNHYQGFSFSLIKKFTVCLLKCLVLLKQENIIHCDLKPENILLRRRGSSGIKVIDFGSSCFTHERIFSYIQSRFYRAPEVILGISYTTAIDIWSLGCVLTELATGYPLFPGENEVEQLACIIETIGLPPDNLINQSTRKRLFFDSKNQPRCLSTKGRLRRPGSRDIATLLQKSNSYDGTISREFTAFLKRCLTWDGAERMSPQEALQHPWITSGSTTTASSCNNNVYSTLRK